MIGACPALLRRQLTETLSCVPAFSSRRRPRCSPVGRRRRNGRWNLFLRTRGVADPLMGWTGGGDTQTQVKLFFDTSEEAIAYAERAGIQYDVELPQSAPDQAKGLRRQFQIRPHRKLDALTGRPDGGLYRSHRRGAGGVPARL